MNGFFKRTAQLALLAALTAPARLLADPGAYAGDTLPDHGHAVAGDGGPLSAVDVPNGLTAGTTVQGKYGVFMDLLRASTATIELGNGTGYVNVSTLTASTITASKDLVVGTNDGSANETGLFVYGGLSAGNSLLSATGSNVNVGGPLAGRLSIGADNAGYSFNLQRTGTPSLARIACDAPYSSALYLSHPSHDWFVKASTSTLEIMDTTGNADLIRIIDNSQIDFYSNGVIGMRMTSGSLHIRPQGNADVQLEVSDGSTQGGGTAHAASFAAHSERRLKSDIKYFTAGDARECYVALGKLKPCRFRYRKTKGLKVNPSAPVVKGLIYDEAPGFLRDGGGPGTISLNDQIVMLQLALQEGIRRIEGLTAKLKKIEDAR